MSSMTSTAASTPAPNAADALLAIDNLGKRFGGFVALDGIALKVKPGERLGLIGPNGSGKSTLVNCICGTLQNEVGSVTFDGQTLDGKSAHQRTRLGIPIIPFDEAVHGIRALRLAGVLPVVEPQVAAGRRITEREQPNGFAVNGSADRAHPRTRRDGPR